MTRIQELFHEAVSSAPPSRLSVDDVFGALAHRRRVTAAVAASLTLVLVGLTTIGVGVGLAGSNTANPPSSGAPPGPLTWAGRGDADHLYRVTNVCGENPIIPRPSDTPPPSPEPIRPDCNLLWTSADGGATWTQRDLMVPHAVTVAGPQTLLRYDPSATYSPPLELSRDGGATWTALGPEGPAVDAVPPGGVIVGRSATAFLVVDPALGRPQQVPIEVAMASTHGYVVSPSADPPTIWLTGLDAMSRRPAVAVSHDGGESWTVQVLPITIPRAGDPLSPEPGVSGEPPSTPAYLTGLIARADGRTAYLCFYDPDASVRSPNPAIPGTAGWGWYRVFRTTDGGATWLDVDSNAVMPSYRHAWLTRDGRLVLHLTDRELDGGASAEYVVSADGRDWAVAAPPGLPVGVFDVDGSVAYTDHAMYVSDDGWTWREVWHD